MTMAIPNSDFGEDSGLISVFISPYSLNNDGR